MATIALTPILLKDVDFTVAGDDYSVHVESVVFTPSASTQTLRTLSPAGVFTDTGQATWVCDIGYVQDWSNPASLSRYLHDHEGDHLNVIFKPKKGTGLPQFAVTVVAIPGAIGGAVDTYAKASVSLPCQSKPVFSDPA